MGMHFAMEPTRQTTLIKNPHFRGKTYPNTVEQKLCPGMFPLVSAKGREAPMWMENGLDPGSGIKLEQQRMQDFCGCF